MQLFDAILLVLLAGFIAFRLYSVLFRRYRRRGSLLRRDAIEVRARCLKGQESGELFFATIPEAKAWAEANVKDYDQIIVEEKDWSIVASYGGQHPPVSN